MGGVVPGNACNAMFLTVTFRLTHVPLEAHRGVTALLSVL